MANFCEYTDIENILQITIGADLLTLANFAITESTAAIQNYTHQTLEKVENDTIIVDGNNSNKLYLPELPVISVSTVKLNGITLEYSTDYKLGQHGILYKLNGTWDSGVQNIEITYSHGYDPIPTEIKSVCARAASRLVQMAIASGEFNGIPIVASTSIGDYSVAYNNNANNSAMGVSGARILLPSEMSILNRYRQVGL